MGKIVIISSMINSLLCFTELVHKNKNYFNIPLFYWYILVKGKIALLFRMNILSLFSVRFIKKTSVGKDLVNQSNVSSR